MIAGTTLIYGSVCSGIEAATVAWHPLGWKPAFFSEIEKFPRAVLAHRWPGVPCHGDFTTIKGTEYGAINLLVGGTPCQSFSVAGLRKGMDDERGNLALEYIRLLDRARPRWMLWENVPGVLSSNEGRDFGAFLGGLAECGYGFAYRILDAQYFGIPQRRRRVFAVGYLGDWRPAAAVLFERDSLRGDIAPRREEGQSVAGTLESRASTGGYDPGAHGAASGHLNQMPAIASSLTSGGTGARGRHLSSEMAAGGHIVMATGQGNAEVSEGRSPSLTCNHEAPIIAHTLRGEGFDASEDGTGRGIPLVPIAFHSVGSGDDCDINFPPTIRAHDPMAIACFKGGQGASAGGIGYSENVAPTLSSADSGTNRTPSLMQGSAVRRLTPRECERLQGFPDDYTAIPGAKDGPRYKALGNSMAVPVMAWIGQRIQKVEDIL